MQAAHTLNKLSAEYMMKEKMAKAKAKTGKKRALEPKESSEESSSQSSDPAPLSDDDDDDDGE